LQDALDDPEGSKIVLVSVPLNPAQPQTALQYWSTLCDGSTSVCAPVDPAAGPEFEAMLENQASGTCLSPEPGTTSYTPLPNSPAAPCFSSEGVDVGLDFGGFNIPFLGLQVGAQYSANPAQALTGGLLKGYLPETAAMNAIIPPDIAVIGGDSLHDHLLNGSAPGGPACPGDDRDPLVDGTQGWWLYLNFTAEPVTLSL
jgi:hypothetical protein